MHLTRHEVDVQMDTSTAGTSPAAYSEIANGYIHAIRYVHDSSNPLSTSCHLSVSLEESGIQVLAIPEFTGTGASKTWYPRVNVCNSSGQAGTYESTSTQEAIQTAMIPVANERIVFQITTSTSTGSDGTDAGAFHAYVG